MRRFPLLFVILLFAVQVSSQVERPKNLPAFDLKRLHFGFTVGFNTMDLAIKRNYDAPNFLYADVSNLQPGFQITVVSDLRLSPNWNLRFLPGISFGQKDLYYYTYPPQEGSPPTVKDPFYKVSMGSGYLEFPLLFKYRAHRVNNYRPYLVGGFNFRYDMVAKKKGGI